MKVKCTINLFVVISLSCLFTQNIDLEEDNATIGSTGSIGTVTINDEIYNQISFRPEIPLGKLGLGLDLYLYFNDSGMFAKSWDFSTVEATYKTLIDKIYYLRWGQPNDDFYFMAGALPSVTLGQGILVENYSNVMEYPQVRQIGFNLQAQISKVDLELVHSNFKSSTPSIMGIRASSSILRNLSLGITFVTDMDQFAGLPDSDGDDFPNYYDYYPNDVEQWDDYSMNPSLYDDLFQYYKNDHPNITIETFLENLTVSKSNYSPRTADRDPISALALDMTYIFNNKITFYSQYGLLNGKINDPKDMTRKISLGWGLVPLGTKAKLGPVNLTAEYRMSTRRFIFNYWDRAYDVNRVVVNSDGVFTRESQLFKYGKLKGFYANANMSLMNIFDTSIGYQNMGGEIWNQKNNQYEADEENQAFLTAVSINSSLIPKVGKVEAFYQQRNVPNPFKFNPNESTIWGYDFGVEISSSVMLIYKARTNYVSNLETDEKFKAVKSLQIETQLIF